MRIRVFFSFIFLLLCNLAFAQSTIVTGTIVDQGGTVWSNATITATFYPTPGIPGPYIWDGGNFSPNPPPVVSNASGVFSITLPSNSAISPAKSQWSFSISPNATSHATVILVPVSGDTIDISSLITANTPAPNISSTPISRVYNTSQVNQANLNSGYFTYDTKDNVPKYWNGTDWEVFGGGSSGNVLPTPQFRLFIQPSPGTQAIAGPAIAGINAVAPELQGIRNAELFGTGTNGISSAFTDCSGAPCTVIAPPTYSTTEADILPPSDGQTLIDLRGGRFLRTIRNPTSAPCSLSGQGDVSGSCTNMIVTTPNIRSYSSFDIEKYAGPGYDLGFSPNSPASNVSLSSLHDNIFEADTRGISQIFGSTLNAHAIGDKAMSYNYLNTDGGQVDGSAEGNVGGAYIIQENSSYYHGTITSGGTTGSPLLITHNTSGQNAFTDGGYLLDISQGSLTGTIASTATVYGYGVWNITSGTMPVSTAWGKLNSNTTSSGQFQVPESQTINVTLGTSPASPGAFVVGNNACLVGGFVESIPITAVGAVSGGIQSVTFSTRYSWPGGGSNAALLMQGGMCGQYLTNTANASWRTAIVAVGSFSPTQVVLGTCSHGSCNDAFSGLSVVVGTIGDSITQFPGAEIIGTNGTGVGGNQVQLGFNTTAWANGDVIEGPHPPAINITPLKIFASQITKANPSGSGLFYESWQGVSPGGSAGLHNSLLSLTDGGQFPYFWRVITPNATAKIGEFFKLDVPVGVFLDLTGGGAPASSMDIIEARQADGGTSGLRYYPNANYAFYSTSSAYASVTASNIPPVGTVGQIPIVDNVVPYTQNVKFVTPSGGATISNTGVVTLHTTGYTGTKTAGTCVFTITNGLITNVTGC